jgi:hypothetical protein
MLLYQAEILPPTRLIVTAYAVLIDAYVQNFQGAESDEATI